MPALAVLLLGLWFASPAPAEVQRAVQQALADDSLQTTHPEVEREVGGGSVPISDLPSPRPHGAGLELAALLKVLLYVAVGVLALLALVYAGQLMADRAPLLAPGAAPPAPAGGDLDVPLEDASALAAEGRYAEAVRVLLLRTFQVLSEEQALPASWTSREIVAHLDLADDARAALDRLVGVVEISLFGQRAPDASTYGSCVDAYRTLRATLGRGTP